MTSTETTSHAPMRAKTRSRARIAAAMSAAALLGAGVLLPLSANAAVRPLDVAAHRVAPRLPATALTLTVNTTADTHDVNPGDGKCKDAGGHCSLRAAIEEANALSRAVTINLAGAQYTTTTLGSLLVTNSHGVRIVGTSATATKINATGSNDRVILDSGLLELDNLTVTGGTAPTTGPTAKFGGGIFVNGGNVSLILNSVTVANNQAQQGGGVYSLSSLWVTNSTITHNTATSTTDSAYGGGITNREGYLNLINSTVSYNVANGGTGYSSRGGGVYDESGAFIQGGLFSHNSALTALSGGQSSGGGLYIDESSTIVGTTFSDNLAGPVGTATNVTALGGGLLGCYGLGSLQNATFTNNTAQSTGTSSSYGGGFLDNCGATTVTGSTFTGNHSVTTGSGDAYGGGIGVGSTGAAYLDISTALIQNNVAQNDTTGTASGGGVGIAGGNAGGSMHMSHSSVVNNRAVNAAGSTNSEVGGGGIMDHSCGAGSIIDSTTIQGNVATNSQGGGVYDDSCGTILNGDKVVNNQATGTTDSGQPYTTEGAGGGLSLYDTAVVTNTLIANNTATQIGGGIYSDDVQTLRGDVVSGNHAHQGAGYFSNYGGLISSTALVHNVATGTGSSGGGLFLSHSNGGVLTLEGATIANNVAAHGAGIEGGLMTAILHGTVLAANTTPAGVEAECHLSGTIKIGSVGGNRVSDTTCSLHGPGDRQGKQDSGYSILAGSGKVTPFNTNFYGNGPAAGAHAIAVVSTPDGSGYWLASSNGTVYAKGGAIFYGSAHDATVAMAAAPDGRGYWLLSATGVVHAFGSAAALGSAPGRAMVAMAVTPDGRGYWLVAKNGAVFNFGTAPALGSKVGQSLVGIASTPDGTGYWLVTRTGTVFGLGSAKTYGSATGQNVVAIAGAPDGLGYWLLGASGAIYNFGSAVTKGSLVTQHHSAPVVSFTAL